MTDRRPEPVRQPLWRRLRRPALMIAALALVFGWLLPQFIDYEEVWDALTELDGWEVVVLLGLGLARVPTEALTYRAFLPGLGLAARKRGVPLLELRRATAPSSERERRPVRLLPRRRIRAGRRRPRGVRLVSLPDDRPARPSARRARRCCSPPARSAAQSLLAGAISLVVTAVAGIAGYVFLRREGSARWLGVKVQRPLSWILVKLKRDPIDDAAEKGDPTAGANARNPARRLGLRVDRRRRQPLRHVPDPARVAPLRRRLERRAVRGRGLRRLRDRLLGGRGVPDHRKRSGSRRRCPHRHAHRAEQRLRRRPRSLRHFCGASSIRC